MTENDVKTQIIDYLRYKGALILRINSGAAASEGDGKRRFVSFVKWFVVGYQPQTAGVADILALIPGEPPVFLAIECKAPQRRANVSAAQRRFMDEWRSRGGVAVVACGVEDLEAGLPMFDRPDSPQVGE